MSALSEWSDVIQKMGQERDVKEKARLESLNLVINQAQESEHMLVSALIRLLDRHIKETEEEPGRELYRMKLLLIRNQAVAILWSTEQTL